MTDHLRARKIDRKRHPNAPRTKLIRDARKLHNHPGLKGPQIGVHVIDGHTIDPNRGQQPAVIRDARQIGANMTVIKKNAATRITPFDTAIEVVPLIHPSNWRRRAFRSRFRGQRLLGSHQCKKMEYAIQLSTRVCTQDDVAMGLAFCFFAQRERLWWEFVTGQTESSAQSREIGQDNGVAPFWKLMRDGEGTAKHRAESALEFFGGSLIGRCVTQNNDLAGKGNVARRDAAAERSIAKPAFRSALSVCERRRCDDDQSHPGQPAMTTHQRGSSAVPSMVKVAVWVFVVSVGWDPPTAMR